MKLHFIWLVDAEQDLDMEFIKCMILATFFFFKQTNLCQLYAMNVYDVFFFWKFPERDICHTWSFAALPDRPRVGTGKTDCNIGYRYTGFS